MATFIAYSTCNCGGFVVVGNKPSIRICESCGDWWYENHCWNCKAKIDSRIHPRDETGWCVCGSCGVSAPPNPDDFVVGEVWQSF